MFRSRTTIRQGAFFRIRNTHDLFANREFQGAPILGTKRPTYLVLDGQQRLTSLYQAFYGVGDHRYFLDLKKLIDGSDFEDAIFHLRANLKKARDYEDVTVQASDLILPLGVLRNGASRYIWWVLEVIQRRDEPAEQKTELQKELVRLGERWIQTIDDYQFPVVTLSDQTSADAVCTIFETLNRTGVKLSVFELLTARFWPKNVNLRQLWEKAQEDYPIIADFGVDPYYLLQIVALVSRSNPSCKRSEVLDLDSTAVADWWDRASYGLASGLKILQEDCGVIAPQWLPYNTIVNPLGAALAKLALRGTPEVGANRQKLIRWYWCSILGQMYEKAPNSQTAKDTTELLRWLGGGEPPESVSQLQFDPNILRDTTPRQRAVYRGVIGLVLETWVKRFPRRRSHHW